MINSQTSSTQNNTPTNSTNPGLSGSYVPGVCNINTVEIARRRKAAYVLLAITIVIAAPLLLLDIPVWTRLILFFPIFLTVVCSLQVKYKFCVGYGASGMQNATEGDKEAQAIVEAASLKLDKDRTRKIKLQAAGIAAVITLLTLLLPS